MYSNFSVLSRNRTLAFAKHSKKMRQNEPFFAQISY